MKKGRVFSGARPTGKQHIGNYLGAIQNYVKLQDEYECVYCIVDIHALTTIDDTKKIQSNIREMALDWLAAGIDPEKSIVFVQSHVPEVTELFTYLGMVTPLGWLTRVPTFKEKVRMHPENVNYGLLGYPVLMAADIVLYKADTVPVGEDQLPHLELTREIVRRFTDIFGDVFPEPKAKLTEVPLIVGLDGVNKMSKSLNNQIDLAATAQETEKRIATAFTDPARKLKSDPGHPDICNIYSLHKIFTKELMKDKFEPIVTDCREAKVGCVQCKKLLASSVNLYLTPFREKRQELALKPGYIEDVL
ncbi:MAG: tryptophan--tRNA ligase, partial [Chloroflexi bacterium]|nr:tryptophan--tRNA ligase [Chloroflexota bacterium]